MQNEGKAPLGAGGALRIALSDPFGFAVYVAVVVSARFDARRRSRSDWSRGR